MSSHVFISPGDPAGIGPEITLKSLKNFNETHKFVIAGDIQYFENLSASLKLGFKFIPYGGSKTTSSSKLIEVINIPLQENPVLGSSSVNNAKYILEESITEDLIYNKLKVLSLGLKRLLKKENLKICVLGLNPHAGEGGYIGTEESTTIIKGIKKFDQREVTVDGPISADTAFSEKNLSHYDAFLAMFHDQGMIPAKILGFGQTLNITFGLPYLRISVDHGTALDIANDMNADFSSMKLALETALASLDEKK